MSKRKLLAWALVLALCIGLVTVPALAADFEAVGSATEPMTNAEMCENIRRVLNGHTETSFQISDMDSSDPYYEAICFCILRNYIQLYVDIVFPDAPVNRATLANCLVNMGCRTSDVDSVKCLDTAGNWADEDIKQVLALEIMTTDEDGWFYPGENATVSDVDWDKVKSICNPDDTPHIIDPPKLPTPTDLEWNIYYERGGTSGEYFETKQARPGWVVWKTNAEVNCDDTVRVYRKGVDEDVFTLQASSGGVGWPSHVWEHENRWISNYLQDHDGKLIPGTYYFTVQTHAKGYQDSEVATSPQWTYTDPGKVLATPSKLSWDGVTIAWSMEENTEPVLDYVVQFYYSSTLGNATTMDGLKLFGIYHSDRLELNLENDIDMPFFNDGYYYARVRAYTADFNLALDSEWSELSPAYHYVDTKDGYVFIRSNKWTAVPNLENTYWVEIVDTDGQLTTMRVTESLKDAIAKDSMILSESRDYVGHFFAVGEIENGVVSRLEPIRDLQDITDMGQGVITLQNNAYGYDSDTKFIYVDMGWADGDDPDNMLLVCEPDRDKLAFLESGQFNPEGFYNANDVNADNNDDGETYSSVRASVIARGDYAEYVYVVRTDWWPAPALGPDQPSQSAQPSASPSASPEPSASSEPSAAPSASPSPSPSAKPSGGSSVSRRPVASVPVETPVPTPSPEPVEPSEVPITPASELFDDVVKGSWYEPGVTYVVIQGLFKGMDVGIFSPNTNMTRAMVMTVLARMDGQDTTNATNGPWHTNIMNWAKAKGISDGTMPDSSVTREQLVTLLYRYARPAATAGDLTAFADGGSVSAWAERAMVWAVNQEIITGKNGSRLDPQGFATRAEVATIFQRFVQKIQPDSGVGG